MCSLRSFVFCSAWRSNVCNKNKPHGFSKKPGLSLRVVQRSVLLMYAIVFANPTSDCTTHFIVRRSQHVTLHDAAVATSTGRCGSHAAAGAARAAAAAPGPPSQTVAEPASSNLK